MITLGITGGIGAGKSVVCRLMAELGVPVYDTDREAKSLYDRDLELKSQMCAMLGDDLYATVDGCLDRRRLAELIFSSSELLAKVEALVHPAVRQDIARWQKIIAQNIAYQGICVIESALLLSSAPLMALVDRSLVVIAPDELRIARAINRDNVSREAVLARMSKQLSQEEMLRRVDDFIVNDGKTPLLPQVYRILSELGYSLL